MINLEEYLYERTKAVIDTWNEDGIYAISFFLYSNEAFSYGEYSNVSEFNISYNAEKDCESADALAEERWNYAAWRQNETPIINANKDNEGAKILFQWYDENNIENIGLEIYDSYDENHMYIGKGPVGYYELLTVVSNMAFKLQKEGYITGKFGHPLPIIIHDLEYAWYSFEATNKANPNGEADTFFKAMKELGFMG